MKRQQRRRPGLRASDIAYVNWLMAGHGWTRREADAYIRGGNVELAKIRGQIERERKATTLLEVIEAAEARRAKNATGISRAFLDCGHRGCTLPFRHTGPHQYPRRNFVTLADLEEGEPQ